MTHTLHSQLRFLKSPTLTRLVLLLVLFFAISLAALGSAHRAGAVSAAGFNPGLIIADNVFYNASSMSVNDIQAFLNAKVPVCDTNHASYNGGSGVVYNPPWICLKDYTMTTTQKPVDSLCKGYASHTQTAAQVIYGVSESCGINPQVLLVLLQKEQSLVTDTWPGPWQYRSATGFACGDNSACESQYYGLFNQLYGAARQFKMYKSNPNGYNHVVARNNTIYYNPGPCKTLASDGSCAEWYGQYKTRRDIEYCGSAQIYIQSQATAALYNYTPYIPNESALNAGYGSGDGCAAYGNRNFWLYFTDWFGSTTGPDYSWDIVSFNYAGGDNSVGVGETETITLKARNTGRNPWYNHGSNAVRLATWEPADRISRLFHTNRLATLQESVVPVGQVGTFTYTITPSEEGTYVEGLNLVAENAMFMPWTGLRPTINVTSAYAWSVQDIIYENATGVMNPGTKQLITVVAKNIGNATWSKTTGPAIKLATWSPDRLSDVSATWLSKTRVTYMNESTVLPGQTAGFQFYVTVPPSGGYYYEKLNLVAEGQRWFNDPGLTLYLYGKQHSWQPLWHTHSTGTANIARNTDFTITVKIRNTGDATWSNTGSFPLLLGTSKPLNRGSAFYSSSWISDTRPTKLIESTVAPGEEGTFVIPMHTPNTPGARYEYFRPVAEGLIWLNDPGFRVYINVL